MPEMAVSAGPASHLEALAAALNDLGVTAKITHGRLPFVHAVSSAVRQLSEKVYVAQADGSAWYFWSWAEPIAPAGEPAAAASKIARVLAGPAAAGPS